MDLAIDFQFCALTLVLRSSIKSWPTTGRSLGCLCVTVLSPLLGPHKTATTANSKAAATVPRVQTNALYGLAPFLQSLASALERFTARQDGIRLNLLKNLIKLCRARREARLRLLIRAVSAGRRRRLSGAVQERRQVGGCGERPQGFGHLGRGLKRAAPGLWPASD